MSRTQRAFIAFPILKPDTAPFMETIEELEAVGLPYNWVPAQNLHMTAAFLGSVTDDELEKTAQHLTKFAAGIKTLELELSGVTGFPSKEKSRVLAIRFKGNQIKRLQRNAADLRRLLQQQQIWFDDQAFVPHVTVGRSNRWHNISFYDYLVPEAAISLPAPRLYTSKLSHDGAEYSLVE